MKDHEEEKKVKSIDQELNKVDIQNVVPIVKKKQLKSPFEFKLGKEKVFKVGYYKDFLLVHFREKKCGSFTTNGIALTIP